MGDRDWLLLCQWNKLFVKIRNKLEMMSGERKTPPALNILEKQTSLS